MESISHFILNQRFLTGAAVLLLLLSIICQIMIGVLYQNMIKETDNMAATTNKVLKQCKLKFCNCYKLNMGTMNVGAFVDKFLNRIKIGKVSLSGIGHLSGQLMLGSVFAAGVGICNGIIEGMTFGALLPYYALSLFGLYAYFSVASLVDIQGKRRVLKTNLVDYLENHMINHLNITREIESLIESEESAVTEVKDVKERIRKRKAQAEKGETESLQEQQAEKTAVQIKLGEKEEEELAALLKEFLA